MASKVIIVGLLCIVLAAVVQSAPQYAKNEEPTYDESTEDEEAVPSAGGAADKDDDYETVLAGISESFGTAADAGRRVGAGQRSIESASKQAESDSSASDE
uniref:Salivary thrombin inhibitor anophelin n=1 Tax=Anopheles atroparvus TaxID=41427 RepID=A0AAG5DVG7_ANOAO